MASNVRQLFHQDCESALNKQINMELYTWYSYQAMSMYLDRHDVALPGGHKYFKKMADEKRENAEKLMKYQNQRGGRVVFTDVKVLERKIDRCVESGEIQLATTRVWNALLEAFKYAQVMERAVNENLLDLHKMAGNTHYDVQLCDFLEEHFLKRQVESIKEMGDHITNLERVGSGLGEYMFDRETLNGEE